MRATVMHEISFNHLLGHPFSYGNNPAIRPTAPPTPVYVIKTWEKVDSACLTSVSVPGHFTHPSCQMNKLRQLLNWQPTVASTCSIYPKLTPVFERSLSLEKSFRNMAGNVPVTSSWRKSIGARSRKSEGYRESTSLKVSKRVYKGSKSTTSTSFSCIKPMLCVPWKVCELCKRWASTNTNSPSLSLSLLPHQKIK